MRKQRNPRGQRSGHYRTKSGIEPIHVIEQFKLGFHLGAAVKYILRAGKKGPANNDLEKAIDFLCRERYGKWYRRP